MRARFVLAGAVSLALLLSACGGGGSDGGTSTTPSSTTLPGSVTIQSASSVDTSGATQFSSDAPAGSDVQLQWDFGDGSTSTDAQPSHQYVQAGEYKVTLTVTNGAGESRTTTFQVTASRMSLVTGLTCSGTSGAGWCWQRPKPIGNTINDLSFVDASTGWAVGEYGEILKTTDGGVTWLAEASGTHQSLQQARMLDANHGWATGMNGTVLRTNDGGATWALQAPGFSMPSNVTVNATNTLFQGTDRALILGGYWSNDERITTDGGTTWSAVTSSGFTPLAMTPNGTLWALQYVWTANGNVYTVQSSSDGGNTYTPRQQWSTFAPAQLSFGDDQHGWVAGYDQSSPGTIQLWQTTDGGNTWQVMQPTGLASTGYWYGSAYLKFVDATHGWLLDTSSTLYRTQDGGASWTPVGTFGGANFYGAPDADTAIIFSYWDGYHVTRDGGQHWSILNVAAEAGVSYPSQIRLADSNYWLQYADRWYRTSDNGSTWTQVFGAPRDNNNAALRAAWFFDGTHGTALSSAGQLLDTTDGGQTWASRSSTTNGGYGGTQLKFHDASTGWLLTGGYSLSLTTDGGKTWQQSSSFANAYLTDFDFVDAGNGWCVDVGGVIRHSIDGGKSWTAQASFPFALYGVHFTDAQHGVAVGAGGNVAQTADGGATWTPRNSGSTDTLQRVTFSDATHAWAVTNGGGLLTSSDGGTSWAQVAIPRVGSLNDVRFVDSLHGWAVGGAGAVLATADGGQTWRLQDSGTGLDLYGVFALDTRTVWAVGANGSVLVTATGGQ
jgi:photosystem II stability/assembly factor-like uncharacterized protein